MSTDSENGAWRKSTHSAGGNCVEAGGQPGTVGVRDTKEAPLGAARTVLEFTPAAWSAFLGRLA